MRPGEREGRTLDCGWTPETQRVLIIRRTGSLKRESDCFTYERPNPRDVRQRQKRNIGCVMKTRGVVGGDGEDGCVGEIKRVAAFIWPDHFQTRQRLPGEAFHERQVSKTQPRDEFSERRLGRIV